MQPKAEQSTGGTSKLWLHVLASLGLLTLLGSWLLPSVGSCGGGRRSQCRHNLKQIGIALHNYHDVFGSFPPAFTVNDEGQRLHSWRTLILPFMDQGQLFEQIDLSRSWDHPANEGARNQYPLAYRCLISELPEGYTSYMAVVGRTAVFGPNGESTSVKAMEDGTSFTVVVVETTSHHAVHWMNPNSDAGLGFLNVLPDSPATHHTHVLFADGSVHSLTSRASANVLNGLVTHSGGEELDYDSLE